MKIAYADPPYVGQARRHYGCEEIDHERLIWRLNRRYSDGWALSASSPSLEELLLICRDVLGPNKVRIAAWVKPFCVFKKGVRPAYAWEPIIFVGGRNRNHPPPPKGGKATTPKDFVSANITLRKGLVGAKPPAFCFWLFDLMGLRRDDEFVDLYPGTGIVSQCWQEFTKADFSA